MIITQHGKLAIRLMEDTDQDYKLVATWLSDPLVLEFYEGRDKPQALALVKEKYSARVLHDNGVTPCILKLEDKSIGYLQFYLVDTEQRLKLDLPSEKNIYGIDMFIGETNFWNKGLGSQYLKLLIEWLKTNKQVDQIIVDPRISNLRAIRAYEKAGFRSLRKINNYGIWEGQSSDNVLMSMKIE